MAKAKEQEQTKTRYLAKSAITGAVVCGPYDRKADAEREVKRLNREAISGVREAPPHKGGRANEPINMNPAGQPVPVLHKGKEMSYEIVTEEGVVLA